MIFNSCGPSHLTGFTLGNMSLVIGIIGLPTPLRLSFWAIWKTYQWRSNGTHNICGGTAVSATRSVDIYSSSVFKRSNRSIQIDIQSNCSPCQSYLSDKRGISIFFSAQRPDNLEQVKLLQNGYSMTLNIGGVLGAVSLHWLHSLVMCGKRSSFLTLLDWTTTLKVSVVNRPIVINGALWVCRTSSGSRNYRTQQYQHNEK